MGNFAVAQGVFPLYIGVLMLWPLKIIIKVILAHLPIPYRFWQKLGLFRHGQMDRAGYAEKIFSIHTNLAYPNGAPKNLRLLELGPGDSLASTLLAYALGAAEIHHVDVGDFATHDMTVYQKIAHDLTARGLNIPDLSSCPSRADMLHLTRGHYHTHGLDDLRKLPDHSIDFSWSHSVLEHVRRRDMPALFHELKRVTTPGGFSSHLVDLQDHLDHSINNLRFPEWLWEANWFAAAGFYTNRLQAGTLRRMAENAGFKVVSTTRGHYPALPIPRTKLAAPFRDLPDDELRTRTFSLVLQA